MQGVISYNRVFPCRAFTYEEETNKQTSMLLAEGLCHTWAGNLVSFEQINVLKPVNVPIKGCRINLYFSSTFPFLAHQKVLFLSSFWMIILCSVQRFGWTRSRVPPSEWSDGALHEAVQINRSSADMVNKLDGTTCRGCDFMFINDGELCLFTSTFEVHLIIHQKEKLCSTWQFRKHSKLFLY